VPSIADTEEAPKGSDHPSGSHPPSRQASFVEPSPPEAVESEAVRTRSRWVCSFLLPELAYVPQLQVVVAALFLVLLISNFMMYFHIQSLKENGSCDASVFRDETACCAALAEFKKKLHDFR
jgi:hypothetical protein